jgi:MSHA biogenesis protein MshJ
MKQLFLKLGMRVDAMTLRERVLLFAATAGVIVFVAYALLLAPLFARQNALRAQVAQNQNNINGIEEDVTRKVNAYAVDPDAANRARLAAAKGEVAELATRLRTMQNGLVAPEKMAGVLETILRSNARLRLTGMKTLPVAPVSEGMVVTPAATPAAPGATPAKPAYLLYRHGVELTVRGSYLDMVGYMSALEGMSTRLFWDNATMEVDQYPNATLTLSVYTLSLDQKWIQL